eukprot:TRINITY_DN4617_c0_g1_i2.p1 TRINITY_DN4617_c0_g1~~TRINITY_DN4617_c0_g1_i2.p1  ORF type:complete len:201 (-),score=43.25 TRINITY_DN4617_c0_g1_i2:182-784(-)
MNFEHFVLPELEVTPSEVKTVLRCVLHTVFFHRALGLTRPRDVFIDKLGVAYASCGNLEMERLVEMKVSEFCDHLTHNKQSRGQMKIRFLEKKEQGFIWKVLGSQDDKVCWEEWVIQLRVVSPNPNAAPGEDYEVNTLGADLRECIQTISAYVNQKKDHIPPVPKELTGLQSFYHEVKVVQESSSGAFSAIQGISGAKLI